MLVKELLKVGGRGGMGGAEVEAAVPRVALCMSRQASSDWCKRVAFVVFVWCRLPCNKTMGFLSASACLISSWQ